MSQFQRPCHRPKVNVTIPVGHNTITVDHITVPEVISLSQLASSPFRLVRSPSQWPCHRPRDHVIVLVTMSPSQLVISPSQLSRSPSYFATSPFQFVTSTSKLDMPPSQLPCHNSSLSRHRHRHLGLLFRVFRKLIKKKILLFIFLHLLFLH